MPENTFIYDTVWEEFREELQLTYDEMCEAIMFNEDRSLFNELMDRGQPLHMARSTAFSVDARRTTRV